MTTTTQRPPLTPLPQRPITPLVVYYDATPPPPWIEPVQPVQPVQPPALPLNATSRRTFHNYFIIQCASGASRTGSDNYPLLYSLYLYLLVTPLLLDCR